MVLHGANAGREPVLRPPKRLTVAIVLGAFLGMIDATVVAVAPAPMSRHFGVGAAAAQQTLGIYLIVVTATVPTLGRVGDRLGRNRSYIAGFAVFIVGSVAAALAPNFAALLAARAVQAVGGGMLTAGSLALIAEHAPRRRTGRSVALLVVAQAIAGLLGPPVGGLMVSIWGWQAVFWAGIPVAVAGITLTVCFVPPSVRDVGTGTDVPGALALGALLFAAAAGIASLGGSVDGGVPAGWWFAAAVVAALVLWRIEVTARSPVLDPRLLGDRRFRLAGVATFLSTGTLMSCFALLPFWLEDAHGTSAAAAGLTFLPIGIGLAATSRRGGRMGDRGDTRRATVLGMTVAALGLSLAALAAVTSVWAFLGVGLLILGCGNGLFSSPNTAAAIARAPRTALGGAAGFLSTARNAGVVAGLSAAGGAYAAGSSRGHRFGADVTAALIFTAAALICLAVAALAASTYRTVD